MSYKREMQFRAKQIAPPREWGLFEDLCHALFKRVWNDPLAQKNGRRGQAQHGVDVFGSENGYRAAYRGVQCKGKDGNYGSKTEWSEVLSELAKADTFSPKLEHWIFATTAPVDGVLQRCARELSIKRRRQGLFGVDVLGWDEILALLAESPDVAAEFYPEHIDHLQAAVKSILQTSANYSVAISANGTSPFCGDGLLSRLKPYLEFSLANSCEAEAAADVRLSGGAPGLLIGPGHRPNGAFHRAVYNRIGRARGREYLDTDLQNAITEADRDAAFQRFLSAEPELQKSLLSLLARRDYLQALSNFCDDLPISDLVPGSHRLSDVFVAPRLSAINKIDAQSCPTDRTYDCLLSDSNHIVIGDAGSGKSSLARWIARNLAAELLDGGNKAALDQLRIPVYISAADLGRTNWPTAIRNAIDGQLGLRGLSKLPDEFFDPHAEHGHRLWTFLIDGFDEIDSQSAREVAFQVIADVKKREPEAFRFILFARPGTVPLPSQGFETWKIARLSNHENLIDKYLESEILRRQLSSVLGRPDYREIARNPFFVAMSAALIPQIPRLPSTPFALVEAFIDYAVGRTSGTAREAVYELLVEIAGKADVDVAHLVKANRKACEALSGATSSVRIQRDVDMALRATGLVRITQGGRYRFLHRLIDRHLLAEVVASSERPHSAIWNRLDPRSLGWAAVEQLCVRWADRGQDAGAAIAALSDFGADGAETMLRLAIQLPDIPDVVFERPITALFEELANGELTAVHDDMLPRLAGARKCVRQQLHRIVRRSRYSFDMVPAAKALAEVGEFETIRVALVDAANDEEGDPYTQSEIASLMLENGLRDEAITIFVRVSDDAADDWMRLDAACRYHRAEQSETSRGRLRKIIQDDYVHGKSMITPWLMEQVLDFGEIDLALPLLREGTEVPITGYREHHFLQFDQSRQAAVSLARYDMVEGLSALEKLLVLPSLSLREQADILEDMHKIAPLGNAPNRLEKLVRATPLQTDWRVIEILIGMGLEHVAWDAARQLIRNQFNARHFSYDVRQVLKRVALIAKQDEIETLINEGLAIRPVPELAWSLALIGKGQEARAHLEAMLEGRCRKTGIEAARLLSEVGARRVAKGWLTRLARDRGATPEIRLEATGTLVHVADAVVAMSAYRKLVRDPNLNISVRCEAAKSHARISGGDDDDVVEALQRVVRGPGPPGVKLTALKTVYEIDPYEDCSWGYEEEFLTILNDDEVIRNDLPIICELAIEFELNPVKLPKIGRYLSEDSTPATLRIEALSSLAASRGGKRFARQALAELATDKSNSWRIRQEAICALHPRLPARVVSAINETVNDSRVPPKWRLDIAKGGWQISGYAAKVARLNKIRRDASISIGVRLEAFQVARRVNKNVEFPDFSAIPDLTIPEHILISEAAHSVGLTSVARTHFFCAWKQEPKAVHELVSVFNLSVSLGDDDARSVFLSEICNLPIEVLRHTDDTEAALDAIGIIGQVDRNRALSTLTTLLLSDDISIWTIPSVIERMTSFIDESEALRIAHPVLDEVVKEVVYGRHTYAHVPTSLAPFYERGWISSVEPLLEFAQDRDRRFSEKVGAVVLAMQTNEGIIALGRSLLNRLLENVPDEAGDTLVAASELMRAGFRADALILTNRLSEFETLSSHDTFRLARLLDQLGHRAAADQHLKLVELRSMVEIYLTDEDKVRLREVFGEAQVDAMLRSRLDASRDPIERIHYARNLVDEEGDVGSLEIILSVACDVALDSSDRLEAIDALNELGFRELSRTLFETLDLSSIEPIWVAEQCSRFGMKSRALEFFRRAFGRTHPDNEHLIYAGLADLGAVDDICRFGATA